MIDANQQKIIANFKINRDSYKLGNIKYIEFFLTKIDPENVEHLLEIFEQKWDELLDEHELEDTTDISRFYRLITTFKPALSSIVKPGQTFDSICDVAVESFNGVLNRMRRQINDDKFRNKPKGAILPGSNKSLTLSYFCTVCKQIFNVDPKKQDEILNSEDKVELPKHCDKEMEIKIIRNPPKPKEEQIVKEIKIYPAELLMGHLDSSEAHAEYLKVMSVGIDIGSSTSHLIFSQLTLKREMSFFNLSNRFVTVNREIKYEGNIIFTPLIDRTTIDIEAIVDFCKEEYKKAGFTPEMVDTGAVVVTGETAKKYNAAEIVRRLSSESGKFVSATAGPNFESVLGAMGSGIVALSKQNQKTILNVDIGGGTSNLAISSNGTVLSTACINVGGRLLGIDKNFKIWRIDGPTEFVMKYLNMHYTLGDIIPEVDVIRISREYAKILLEVMSGRAQSPLAKDLLMTEDLDFSIPIDEVSFSGGVAEMIYGNNAEHFDDIGSYLAAEIKNLITEKGITLIEPENKIRATVIGAGAFSLSISGSTCYYDPNIQLPMENIPIIPINITLEDVRLNFSKMRNEVTLALRNFDFQEGEDIVALYFKNPMMRSDISLFAKAIESALPNSIENSKLILIILGSDGGKILGLTLKKETSIKSNLFCLDELDLKAGDWIDIGRSLKESNAFPITIKSLVFNKDKKPKME
ncbi:ethanolamine ammonia-lyase reactivating factor EutA [Candidatus Lokiarchaeum ossiferum]|uniref:ethanolamine ammonia-lyase reactivating factor EutA n=1 Tax=Candidatus Lokiarchaeum ossiferum TaxID=2951803 RepID=UPI00352C893D